MPSRRNRYRAKLKVKKKGSRGGSAKGQGRALWPGRRTRTVLACIAAVVILPAAVWAAQGVLTYSPIFTIKRIQIEGASLLDPDDIRDLMSVDVGENLFAVDIGHVRRDIEREPSIRRALIRRILPDTLSVTVDQRQPVTQVKAGRSYYLMDAEGVIAPPRLKSPDPSLPVILDSGFSSRRAKMGERYVSDKLELSLKLLAALNQGGLPFEGAVKTIDARHLKDLSFDVVLPAGSKGDAEHSIRIHMGQYGFAHKLELLGEVYEGVKGEMNEVKYIDLRFEDVVIGHR